ncbi:CsbD family protein [Streptomyces sp. NPDC045714]|uniref:CsbD family protein n=1 Tax=Streptomyces sp. NPDC045714 TaxID=3154913 RepID=UPI00340EE620
MFFCPVSKAYYERKRREAKCLANEAIGNVKQGVGKVTDNDKLRAEAKAQKPESEAQQAKDDDRDA